MKIEVVSSVLKANLSTHDQQEIVRHGSMDASHVFNVALMADKSTGTMLLCVIV